jgi:uncharacterized protein (DUF342 family)
VSSIEGEQVERLESLKQLLSRKIDDLKKEKQRYDRLVKIVKEINEKERAFIERFSKLEKLNEKMLSYLDGSNVYEKVQLIEQDLQQAKSEYEQKGLSIEEEITKVEFDDKRVTKYHEDISLFLDMKIGLIDDLIKRQKEILDGSISKVKDGLAITGRLINALSRKAGSSSQGGELRGFLTLMQARIEKMKNELPSSAEDLEKICERTLESFKGLYERTKKELISLREELRRFAIENGLVEKDEATVLEAIYTIAHETGREEFEFGEALELLRRKMPGASDQDIQNALLSLSRKALLTLTLVVE